MNALRIVREMCAKAHDVQASVWDLVTATRGPDTQSQKASEYKRKFTEPIRCWLGLSMWYGPEEGSVEEVHDLLVEARRVRREEGRTEQHYFVHVISALDVILECLLDEERRNAKPTGDTSGD